MSWRWRLSSLDQAGFVVRKRCKVLRGVEESDRGAVDAGAVVRAEVVVDVLLILKPIGDFLKSRRRSLRE